MPDEYEDYQNVAVIDVGSSAIRMEIAAISREGTITTLDRLTHATNLGRDVFTDGNIQIQTVDHVIDVLNGYKFVLRELGIDNLNNVWAVGTSAVREAYNRETFLDRVFNATGIQIEALDVTEIHRLTYNMIRKEIDNTTGLKSRKVMVLEIGGGLTEILFINRGHVSYSNTYSLGVLRVQKELDSVHATPESVESLLNQHLKQIEESFIVGRVKVPKKPVLIAISGDVRFAAKHLENLKNQGDFQLIPTHILDQYSAELIRTPVEKIAQEYQLTYPQAESLGPSLLCYVKIAKYFNVSDIYVTCLNFRNGMLQELCRDRAWTREFENEIIFSAITLGKKYAFDRKHAECVASISVKLFHVLAKEHRLGRKQELILRVAALLHDIGFFISNQSHHKHSLYLILNTELFGLPESDRLLIGLIARYHRRALPKKTHPEYQSLGRYERLMVNKLAAMLRVADALDRNHLQQAKNVDFEVKNNELIITVHDIEDPTTERIALKQKAEMFEEVFGLKIRLQKGRKLKGL